MEKWKVLPKPGRNPQYRTTRKFDQQAVGETQHSNEHLTTLWQPFAATALKAAVFHTRA
jgi:hypothetical protein